MTRHLPPHVSPTHVIAAAERLFHASALRYLHAKCRDREIKKANILPAARHETDVFVHDLRRMLARGGADDYSI